MAVAVRKQSDNCDFSDEELRQISLNLSKWLSLPIPLIPNVSDEGRRKDEGRRNLKSEVIIMDIIVWRPPAYWYANENVSVKERREPKCRSQEIKVLYRKDDKILDDKSETKPQLMKTCHHRYSLVVRPNGLQYTAGYGKAMGVWFRPLPSDNDAKLSWPARAKISISILNTSGREVITTPIVEDAEWDEEQTTSPYPAFKFNLTALQHSEVAKSDCVDIEGYVTVVVNEY